MDPDSTAGHDVFRCSPFWWFGTSIISRVLYFDQRMSHIVLIGGIPRSLTNFRGDFISACVAAGHRVTAMSGHASDEQISRIKALGADFTPYPVERNGLNPFADLNTLLILIKRLRALHPDVVIAYTIKPVIWSGIALRLLFFKGSFFGLITGLGYAFREKTLSGKVLARMVSGLYRSALRSARGVIFQNTMSKDVFLEKGIATEDLCHIVEGSGVNLEYFHQMPMQEEDGAPVFLLVARLLREKGIPEFVQAARIVKKTFPSAKFRLLGPRDPSPAGISLEEVERWHDAGFIDYLGRTDDVRPFLAGCHVFVLPSYYGEGLSRSILEAMAVGRPILTTDNPGCRETVIEGENGFIVPRGDAEALSERMVWFCENPARWSDMGKRSRVIAEERYDVNKINRQLMALTGL